MKITKDVRVETEVEVCVDVTDFLCAMHEALSVAHEDCDAEAGSERHQRFVVTEVLNAALTVLKGIDDGMIDRLTLMQRQMVERFFKEQAARYSVAVRIPE